jgi:hypothetical protein
LRRDPLVQKPITNIILRTDPTEDWGGEANYNPFSGIDSAWEMLDLDRHIPYRTLSLPYPGHLYPEDKYKYVRDFCAINYAGLAAEHLLYEQLGILEKLALSEEDTFDIKQIKACIEAKFPTEEQEKEMRNAEVRARTILSNPICWRMVENLANEMTDAVLHGKEPTKREYNGILLTEYKFDTSVIYASFAQTIIGKRQLS